MEPGLRHGLGLAQGDQHRLLLFLDLIGGVQGQHRQDHHCGHYARDFSGGIFALGALSVHAAVHGLETVPFVAKRITFHMRSSLIYTAHRLNLQYNPLRDSAKGRRLRGVTVLISLPMLTPSYFIYVEKATGMRAH